MTFFETVASMLDAQVPALAADLGMSVPELHSRMATHLDTMAKEWRAQRTPSIAYEDPICRLAYIFGHVPINANLFYHALVEPYVDLLAQGLFSSLGESIRSHAEKVGRLRLCAFGGGPGTELIALSKYLSKNPISRAHFDLEFLLLDEVREWAESWEAMKEAIYDNFSLDAPRPFSISGLVLPFDMTDLAQYSTMNQVFRRDLYVFNHVVSEVFDPAKLERLANVVAVLRQKAAANASFVFLDRNDDQTRTAVAGILGVAGLTQVHESKVGGSMDGDEQKEVLAEHIAGIGRRPRVQWRVGPNGNRAAFFVLAH